MHTSPQLIIEVLILSGGPQSHEISNICAKPVWIGTLLPRDIPDLIYGHLS
jgi:hypothetical protein